MADERNLPKGIDYDALLQKMAKKNKNKTPELEKPAIGRLGPATNLRPGGAHENSPVKKQDRKLKENLKKQNFDDL